jgi:hypothetical protein
MNRAAYLLSMLSWLVFACSPGPDCDYPYRENLDLYLLKEVNYTIPDEETILAILPLDGCNPCLEKTIQMLVASQAPNISVVVATADERDLEKFDIKRLWSYKERTYYDMKNRVARYEIGVVAPMIFHFKDGHCVFHSETTDVNRPQILAHFNW